LSKQHVETTLYSLSTAAPRAPDRRTDERFLSLLRVGALIVAERRELCLIRNVSAGGMMIRPYSQIEVGTRLSVELKHGEAVSGAAQWSDNGLVGVTFDEPIDVVALLTSPGDGPAPRMPRIELNCSAWLRRDADVYRTRALNISQGGMCVRTEAALPDSVRVVVSIPGLPPLAGVVKWSDSDSYGIGFNRVLPLADLMNFVQQQQAMEQRKAAG
jgi:PilZ domain